jgi:glycosyltransferase involved in cell wall biosynthesis
MSKSIFIETERLRNLNSGLGQVCLQVGKEITNISKNIENTICFYIPENKNRIFGEKVQYKFVSKWHKFFKINSKAYDVWHCLHQDSEYFPSEKSTKLILTIHDLNFLERPDYSAEKKAKKLKVLQQKINRADVLTAISEFTASEVRKYLDVQNKEIHVIYNGNSLKIDPNEISELPPPTEEFIFSIGIVQSKKNFHVILPIIQQNPDLHFYIAGDDDTSYADEIQEMIEEIGIADRVHFLGIISEKQKIWAYQNCKAFVFPSLSEGFGLPVVEAMSVGKPIFLSNLTSLPEIGGDDAYYFNDFSPENMVKTFQEGMADFEKNPQKSERLRQRAAKFTWKKAAEAYWELYLRLTGKSVNGTR